MLAFKYISFHYLKYFFIILTALVIFMVGFDYMSSAEKLSHSANLTLIYLVYKTFFSIDMVLPLSLVFALISTKLFLIRSNALVSLYSLGYSRVDILKPFIVVSTTIILIFIALHSSSSFSRSQELAYNIREHGQYLSPTRDLFFTYKKKYVYFSKMLPLQEKAVGIRIFSIKDGFLKEVLVASSATYRDEGWLINEADIIIKPDKMDFESLGMKVTQAKDLKILEGFRPKMLDQVYEGKVNFTIKDAIDALILLEGQNIDKSGIRAALYKIFIYPFFVPFLVVILFFLVPISVRFLNVSLFSFGATIAALLIWGGLFMLNELSNTKTISSEVGIILPVFILFIFAFIQYKGYFHLHK